jgi:lipopolysaccharide export system permease protein
VKILTRYILREHTGPLAFALSALTALMLLNQVAKLFGSLVGKGLAWSVIAELFYLSIPFIVAMTLPMAVLVAVLYTFSKLAAENEVTALRASGVSVRQLVRPVLAGGGVLALIMLVFNDQVLPRANHRLRTLQSDIARKKPTFALREQVINEVIPGKIFLRTGHIDPATNKLREVFIYNFEDPAHRKTIYADSGQMGLTADQSTLQLQLYSGYVLQVPRDDPGTLERLYFTSDLVRVRGVANKFEKTENDTYKSDREMTVCEMNTQYQAGVQQLEQARADLARLLGAAARSEATGERIPAPAVVPPPRAYPERLTAGALYCRLISRVFGGVPEAEAAELPQGGARARDAAQPARPLVQHVTPRPAPPPQFATIGQIEIMRARIVDALTTMSRYEVEIQKKFALALACVVFVLFGAPVALRFPRGGVGVVIGVSLVTFALYYVCLIAGETLANKLILSAFWAMWAANAIFTVIGFVLLLRVERTAAIARGGGASELWASLGARLARWRRSAILPARRLRRAG